MKEKVAKTKPDATAPIKSEPKVKACWRPVAGRPSPLWRKLWVRLLINKNQTPNNEAPAKDASEGGIL